MLSAAVESTSGQGEPVGVGPGDVGGLSHGTTASTSADIVLQSDLGDVSAAKAVQTPASLSALTPRKLQLRRKLHVARVASGRIRRRLQSVKQSAAASGRPVETPSQVVKAASHYLSGSCLTLFETQLKFSKVSPKGRRYSNDAKLLALSLYSHGPRAYRFLSEMFALPSRSTLSVWLQSLQILPGFCNDLIRAVEFKTRTLVARDRVCLLMIDEMSVKRFLSYDGLADLVVGYEDCGAGYDRKQLEVTSALVFMIRGLAQNWKQPVGYVLTKSACSWEVVFSLLCTCLDILFDIGLDVKVVLSDQGSNFTKMTSHLGVTVDRPYFTHAGRNYYYMYDPPHLLKSVRNNLFKYTIFFGDQKAAKWSDITHFYEIDQKQRFRLAPKLTSRHVGLPAFSKMKVKLAAQVISRTVAAALETHSNVVGSGASETAEFLMQFNDLFDCMNSSRLRDANRRKRPLSVEGTCEQTKFLNDCFDWLATIRVKTDSGKDVTNTVKCFAGWRLSIAALVKLASELRGSSDFKFIFTRRLNQDPLENFFSLIRQRGGFCDNPTPIDFMRLFKQLCCKQLLMPSVSGNSEVDLSVVLATLTAATDNKSHGASSSINKPPTPLAVSCTFPTDMTRACLEGPVLRLWLFTTKIAKITQMCRV